MKRFFSIALAFLTLTLALPSCGHTPAETDGSQDRAAIIDQLYLLEANPDFLSEATAILEDYGFTVDLWQGEEITVEFFRELPERGYKLIVFRVHSGLLLALEESKVAPLEKTYLFTGETYTTTRYVSEQLTDKVSNALMTEDYPLVFAVNSEFILKDLEGNFNETVIIATGCESYYHDDMPAAFMEKGASAYIGWSTLVSLEYTDEAVLDLLGNLCTKNMTVSQAVGRAMSELGHDPYFNAYLRYYPPESGDKNLKELLR